MPAWQAGEGGLLQVREVETSILYETLREEIKLMAVVTALYYTQWMLRAKDTVRLNSLLVELVDIYNSSTGQRLSALHK